MSENTVNILLVEDDDIDAEGVQRALQKFKIGNPLFRANDGVEALEYLHGKNGKQKISKPHLLLVDLNMPRMGGIELIRNLRDSEQFQQTIIFVLTTSKSEEDKCKAYDLNIAGYLVKSNVGNGFINLIEMLDCYWKVVEFP